MTDTVAGGREPTSLEARLLDIVQQAVIATDVAGNVIFWNAHAERLYGWTAAEALGHPVVDLTASETSWDDAVAIMDRLSRGASWSGEFEVRRKDGSQFTAFVVNSPILDEHGVLTGIVGISTDVSERRALQRRMEQAAKMEAIGRLAGGIAHDFNNLLTVILGHADVTIRSPETDPASRSSMQEVYAAACRAAELTRQLLAFSRQQLVSPRLVDVNGALERLMPMLRRMIEEHVEIRLSIPDERLFTMIDPSQLDQIVMNLTINARDAMPEGGEIRLSLQPVEYGDDGAPVDPDGKYLRLDVSDDGCGMPPDVLAHVFEPFFTTKGSSGGTGIGLATVFGVVEQAGGVIQVESAPGAGTTFHVLLQRAWSPAENDDETRSSPNPSTTRRTVLLVEDEAALRTLTVRILEAAGYEVLAADRASSAMALAESRPERIDLLLTDIVMPGGSGIALAEHLRDRRPGIKVLLMTGYAKEAAVGQFEPDADVRFIQKPFVGAELLAAVEAVLAPT